MRPLARTPGREKPGEQVRFGGQRPESDGDGDVVVRPVLDPDRIAAADQPGLDHPQVRSAPGGLGEPADQRAVDIHAPGGDQIPVRLAIQEVL